jgi:hypothetical protein
MPMNLRCVGFGVVSDQFGLTPQQISYCESTFHAIDYAHRTARNYAATGVGAAKCARHAFIYPNGMGDLQKGERYASTRSEC